MIMINYFALHYTLADITLALLSVSTVSGILAVTPRKFKKLKVLVKYRRIILIVHTISSILALVFFLLTYFLAPKV